MMLFGWLILALATNKILAERCLFSADELLKIKGKNEIVSMDSKEIIAFLKNNPNELEVLNFIGNNRKQIQIKDNYKVSLERIINHNGVDHMICDKRMNQLIAENNEPHHQALSNRRTQNRLYKMTGRIMLVHGIYGSIVSCSHQILSVNCGLSAGGLTTSLVITKLEPIAIAKFAPKIVKMTSRLGTIVGKFIPKARFVIRLVATTETAIKLLKSGGAAVGGIFDVVDICINIKILVDCKTKGGCSDREIRDSIVSMSISGVSFIAGIALAALAMPVAGLVISLVLMMAQIFYTAFSNVFEYSEKYDTTFGEGASIFFRALIFMGPSEDVRMLARRTEYINFSANMMWETLDNYTETVKGFGIGLGDISINNNDVRPTRTVIDLTSRDVRSLSRVVPRRLPNEHAEMICLPAFRDEPYENGQRSYVQSAIYYCDNAMVFIHKGRPNGNTVVLNLQYVEGGEIRGSNEWNNIFLIHDTKMLTLFGGISVTNHFMFLERKSSPNGLIVGGANGTNIIDMSNVDGEHTHKFTYGDKRVSMHQQQHSSSVDQWLQLFNDNFDPSTDSRIYQYIGRANAPNTVYCLIDDTSVDFLLVNTAGGSKDAYDTVIDCPKVILSPFTTFYSRVDRDKVIFDVQTKGYSGADLVSHIYFEMGQIHILFNEFELTSSDTTMSYIYGEQILLVTLEWGESNKFQIFIHGYDITQLSFRLFNKKRHMIIPRIPQGGQPYTPISFEVFAMCSQTSHQNLISNIYDECIADTVRLYKQLKLLITIQFNDSQRHDNFIIGSPYSDVIQFNDNSRFGKGRNGNDIYIVTENNDAIVLNYADDNVLDFVRMPAEIPRALLRRGNSLLVLNVEVRDFFNSSKYQHIAFVDNEMKQFFPLDFTFEMTPFIQATSQQNSFHLDGSFNHSHIVMHDGKGDTDYEMYRDNDDLFILQQRTDNTSCVITIENFYIDVEKWSNVTWVMYYDNGTLFYRYDFIFAENNDIIDYKTKLKQDYLDVCIEYSFNSSMSASILLENSDRIGVLNIDQTISPKNIEITQSHGNHQHLVFTDRESNHTFEIRNWDSISNRISIIELPMSVEHFEPITIRGLNRFELKQTAEMKILMDLAGENYELLQEITPALSMFVKCIISNASLSEGEVNSYKCLDFKSLDEQVKFVNKYCERETLEWLKTNATMNQTRTTLKFLENNLVLQHVFERQEDNNCEPFFLSIYASEFIVDPDQLSMELLAAVNNTDKFKDLIERGANPHIRSNDSFERTLLHMAVLAENLELVKFIVNRQLVNINAYDSQDDTALYYIFKRVSYHCEKDISDANCFIRDDIRNLLDITDYLLSESATMKSPLKVLNIANMICTYSTDYQNIQIFADNLL